MKQHISVEQLSELSDKSREKLEDYVFSNIIMTQKRFIPLLSIGQMIEFLDEECGAWKMESWQEWEIVDTEMNKNITLSKSAELCDALWNSVKEILEN